MELAMSLGENVSTRISYKAYATGAITANTQPTPASDPGTSGGQVLRRTDCTLNLGKDTYQSAEIRTDRQIGDFRHGVRRVTGSLSGELSPSTYFDFIEAMCRGTRVAGISLDQTDLTSVAANNSASTITFAAGDPVALGLRVGGIFRLGGASVAANSGQDFLILSFGGSSNRTLTVYPAPTDMSADTAFTLAADVRVFPPSSSFVSRKFGVEVYHSELDQHRLFTECRVGGVKLCSCRRPAWRPSRSR
jgi:hypothetical protein